MKDYLTSFFVIVLCVIGCNQRPQENDWKQLNLRLNKVLELPDNTHQDSGVYFYHPDFVVTDSSGNIIVADRALNKLFVFNKDGNFLYNIGKRGLGPAEFRRINGMTINNSNEILVFDQASQTIKEFTSSGNYITSLDLKTATVDLEFEQWNNNYLLFYLNDLPANIDENYMLHVYSPNFKLMGEGIPYKNLELLNQDLLISYVSTNGNSHFINNDTLYFAPSLYNGFIYKYEIDKGEHPQIRFRLKSKTKGFTFMKKPAERFKGTHLSYADATTTMAGGKKFQILLHNRSKGLFQLNNGLIVHFTYIEKEHPHKRTFGVELYDKAMHPIGYAPVKDISFDPKRSNMLSWNVVWKDKQDRFYIVDKDADGAPSIRVVTLEGINDIL